MNSGWRCPGCGKCYSPLTPQCFTCGQSGSTGTSTGNWLNRTSIDPYMGCLDPMNCGRKDGFCDKCHTKGL